MEDIFGKAIRDYYDGNYTEDIVTLTTLTEEDIIPLAHLFRTYEDMPMLEQRALDRAVGQVLDVGCGAGSHALDLQQKGFEVCAIDISTEAIEVCKRRGVKDARNLALLDMKDEKFDTILLMMNGTGIFENLKTMPVYLKHLKSLLQPEGQVLVDTADLKYMYEIDEDGNPILFYKDVYYGEVEFVITYKGHKSTPFNWLYLDEHTFAKQATAAGFNFEIVARGTTDNYLARLTIA